MPFPAGFADWFDVIDLNGLASNFVSLSLVVAAKVLVVVVVPSAADVAAVKHVDSPVDATNVIPVDAVDLPEAASSVEAIWHFA